MSCPRLEDSTFFDLLKMGHGLDLLFTLPWKTAETSRKICKNVFFGERLIFRGNPASPLSKTLFFWRSPGKLFLGTFFFWRTLAPCVLGQCLGLEHSSAWPRESLSTRSRSLASKVVSSTPPLINVISNLNCKFIIKKPAVVGLWIINHHSGQFKDCKL